MDPDICNSCGACIAPCPTGAIDNWRIVPEGQAYSIEAQLEWDEVPEQQGLGVSHEREPERDYLPPPASQRSSNVAPRTAAEPSTNLYTIDQPATAIVSGNFRVTELGRENDTHHIVLDFGSRAFPVLEGQSIGIIPPGVDAGGRPHHARQYSVASPRDGERPLYNNVSLTVKRVTEDHNGNPVMGLASNYICDLQKGDEVRVIGPFGKTFLMPNDRRSNLLMVCTGTGSAPMRAMTERRRRQRRSGDGQLALFFGARTPQELPYFGPLMQLPEDFIEINLAFSRVEGEPKCYVQDLMLARSAKLAELLRDDKTHIYVCGLRAMEPGVLEALESAAESGGIPWPALYTQLRDEGRIHFETY